MKMSPAIIVVTFNRPGSLKRLLDALTIANYNGLTNVPLVISIDFQDSKEHAEVCQIARSFQWKNGKKEVIVHSKNLGLKNHILKCGGLSETYDAVIILEDDLYVAPTFYHYTLQMLDRYANDENIAGISLYKHLWNVNEVRPFLPQEDGNDVFFMQFAQSWGQCWTKQMWDGFYQWYNGNKDKDLLEYDNVPLFVRSWSEKSWLKFFICYVVQEKKYFVYPYHSLSTNCGDAGTHVQTTNTISNVPLLMFDKEYRNLPEISSAIRYDAFFEREGLENVLGYDKNDVCIDLYGTKNNLDQRKYWLTSTPAPYNVLKSFSLNFRPMELNVILNSEGSDIFLYDTSSMGNLQKKDAVNEILYDVRNISLKKLLKLLFYKIKMKIQ